MTLTVPKAPVVGGRAPNLSRDNTGGAVQSAVAKFGQTMQRVGLQMEDTRQRSLAERAQIDMTRDLGELRLAVSQNSDPNTIDQDWSNGVAEIRGRYLPTEYADASMALDENWRAKVTNSFDELSNRHALALAGQRVEMQRRQSEANWIEHADTLTNQAAQADQPTYDALLQQGLDQITERLLAGDIDQLDAARLRIELRANMGKSRAIELMNQDPTSFLDQTDQGETFGQDPAQIATWRGQAQGRIERQLAADQRAAEAAATAHEKEITTRLNDFIKIVDKDRLPLDPAFLNDPDVQANPLYPEAMAALQLSEERANLAFMTPDELRQLVEQEQTQPVDRPYQAERLVVLKKFLSDAEANWNTDPYSYARKIGMAVPELPDDLGTATLGQLGLAISHRAEFADFLDKRGFTDKPVFFSPEETTRLRARISVETDPTARADLAGILAVTLGTVDPQALRDLSGDPVFTFAGSYLASGGFAGVAREIFTGQQELKNKNVIMPPQSERLAEGQLGLAQALTALPATANLRGDIRLAADALYASRIAAVEPDSGDIDSGLYQQALHEVLGGTGPVNSETARGGLYQIHSPNGQSAPTLLPIGVSGSKVDDAIATMTQMFGGRLDVTQRERHGLPGDRAGEQAATEFLKSVSTDGLAPTLSGEPLTLATWRRLQLQAVGPDQYRLVFPANSGLLAVENEKGQNFTFSLTRFLQEIGQ